MNPFEPQTLAQFQANKRELLLDYQRYTVNFLDQVETFEVVTRGRANPHPEAKPVHAMTSTRRRAWDAIDFLTLCYSAGHRLEDLAAFYPTALGYWEEHAHWHCQYHAEPAGQATNHVAHFALLGDDFDMVNRMLSFGILLGHESLVPRLIPIMDYNNPRDGMMERILAFYAPDRGQPPDKCTRHLPYFKTLKIFKAAPEQRSELMAEYLQEWYHASRREPYHDSHARNSASDFWGYWSWESAVITYLLRIDDAPYRQANFYPADLLDFARAQAAQRPPETAPLRQAGGQPCSRSGYWFTPAQANSRQRFEAGQTLPTYNSDWGPTLWQWDSDQSD